MPRIRFRLRSLVGLIVVAACLLNAEAMRRRSHTYRLRANQHHSAMLSALDIAEEMRLLEKETLNRLRSLSVARDETTRPMELRDQVLEFRSGRIGMKSRADWHEAMGRKYTEAASRPWMNVMQDFPEPPIPAAVDKQAELSKGLENEFDRIMKRQNVASRRNPGLVPPGPPDIGY